LGKIEKVLERLGEIWRFEKVFKRLGKLRKFWKDWENVYKVYSSFLGSISS
jgi:hypothetical protein